MEINETDIRKFIYFFWKKGLNSPAIAKEINGVLEYAAVSTRTCQRWVGKFNEGDFNSEDKEREGRPKNDISLLVKDFIRENPRATIEIMSNEFNVSTGTIWNNLKSLGLKYVSCRWVPHELSEDNKMCRLRICNELLVSYNENNFLPQLITGDETWIYWRNEGTYAQTKAWAGGDIQRCTNVKRTLTKKKFGCCVLGFEGNSFI